MYAGTVLLRVTDSFQHRKDMLYERQFDVVTGWIIERFERGNVFGLRGRQSSLSVGERRMFFKT